MQRRAEPARELGRLRHQPARDRERRARGDGDLHPAVAVGERRQPLRVGEDVVDLLDERVGREAAVRLAEVHRPARGDDAQTQLSRCAHLGLDQPGAAAREDVVVVEDRRAPGERELREPRARGGVLGLLVDPGPHGVELPQPLEERLVADVHAQRDLGVLPVAPEVALSDQDPRQESPLDIAQPRLACHQRHCPTELGGVSPSCKT